MGSLIYFFFILIIPFKYPLVSFGFLIIGLGAIIGGVALLLEKKIGITIIKYICYFSFTVGAILSLIFMISATYLAGIYGSMGVTASGIFIFFILITAILLILLPGIELYYLNKHYKHED